MCWKNTATRSKKQQRWKKPRLLDSVRSVIRLKHYSVRTEDAYVHWIKRFILFHKKRHPLGLHEGEIAQFLSHLAQHERVSASTQHQGLNAIIFLYHQVLNKRLGAINNIAQPTKSKRLPVVLAHNEVMQFQEIFRSLSRW